jgi:DNA polymerase
MPGELVDETLALPVSTTLSPSSSSSPARARPPLASVGAAVPAATSAAAPAHAAETLAQIAVADWVSLGNIAEACTACGLCKGRKKVVFGVPAPDAPWLFVGEGPGADEDLSGEPFVGQAGKLLDAMLASVDLARGVSATIVNVVKCRPPGNRTPQPAEAAACAPFLDRQIALMRPKLIVALGKTAITRLTGADVPMAALRQKVHRYQGIPVVATYHPAYLLRNMPDKLKAWEDLQFARDVLDGRR